MLGLEFWLGAGFPGRVGQELHPKPSPDGDEGMAQPMRDNRRVHVDLRRLCGEWPGQKIRYRDQQGSQIERPHLHSRGARVTEYTSQVSTSLGLQRASPGTCCLVFFFADVWIDSAIAGRRRMGSPVQN